MEITLERMLSWVGKLDDSPRDDSAREWFRKLLRQDITEVGQIRDYVEECLRLKGDQYNRALQDLVNRVAEFLGFKVVFGRYPGAVGHPGFAGFSLSWQNGMTLFPRAVNLLLAIPRLAPRPKHGTMVLQPVVPGRLRPPLPAHRLRSMRSRGKRRQDRG